MGWSGAVNGMEWYGEWNGSGAVNGMEWCSEWDGVVQ